MNSSETNKSEKTCLTCKQTKLVSMFVIGRNLCKSCRNEKVRNDYLNLDLTKITEQKCNNCEISKNINENTSLREIISQCKKLSQI